MSPIFVRLARCCPSRKPSGPVLGIQKTESIDVMDALGSAIRVDTRGREVMRILPRINDVVNEEWISDKTRQIVDGLKTQRLDRPYIRENGRLRPASWQEALAAVAAKTKATPASRIGAIVGDLAAVEEIFALKLLASSLDAESRLPSGRRQARSEVRPRLLSLQSDDRRHRTGGRGPHHRRQSAQGSARPERAHPQALAERRLPDFA